MHHFYVTDIVHKIRIKIVQPHKLVDYPQSSTTVYTASRKHVGKLPFSQTMPSILLHPTVRKIIMQVTIGLDKVKNLVPGVPSYSLF